MFFPPKSRGRGVTFTKPRCRCIRKAHRIYKPVGSNERNLGRAKGCRAKGEQERGQTGRNGHSKKA
jgi:hypothetical protein